MPTTHLRLLRLARPVRIAAAIGLTAALAAGTVPAATAGTVGRGSTAAPPSTASFTADCTPSGRAVGFSDALDKKTAFGATVGGLSALTRDKRRSAYAAIEDHSGNDPTRMWFFRHPKDPTPTGTLLLTEKDGTPYTGDGFDAEGLAVLPNGTYLVTSEDEPSIHVFTRKGREVTQLPVPKRFEVAPAGEATANATLEGLSVSRDGSRVYAAMEGTLSGDVAADGTATARRILVYDRDPHATGGYRLSKQIGYQVGTGMRISEVATYGRNGLLVLEAAYDPAIGNTIRLVAIPDARHAVDVSRVANLGAQPWKAATSRLVADVTTCPDLGATSKETQANPLMDNYEAMALTSSRAHRGHRIHSNLAARVLLLSDDNFGAGQTTRLLRIAVRLPR